MSLRQRAKGIFGAISAKTLTVNGVAVKGLVTGTVSVNPPSIATVSTGTIAVTIAGIGANDLVSLEPPATLNDDLIYCGHTVTANTVTIRLYNPTGGAIDDTAKTWTYKVVKAS